VRKPSRAGKAGTRGHRDGSLNGDPIDGTALVKPTIDHNLGVSGSRSCEVKRIGTDWFGEG
jgi:hypothetical protein